MADATKAAEPTTDEILKGKLVEYLDQAGAAVRQGADFAMEQAPAVAREIVAYNLAYNAAVVVACLAVLLAAIPAYRRLVNLWGRADAEAVQAVVVVGIIVAAISQLIAFFVGMAHFGGLLKCYFAPRYFVLEQILWMTRGN